jgi:hypothetical protein
MTTTKANELADQIMQIIRDVDPTAAFEALADCYAFQMSLLICPDCRKQAARALKQAIPGMLAHANAMAAEYAGVEELHPSTHTSH